MIPVQKNMLSKESCKHWILRFRPIVLSFWVVIFLNMQSFGEGHEFCFDASKEGYRLATTTKSIKLVHADYGPQCIYQCLLQDESCRSANFRKTSSAEDNCELLRTVDSEEPPESLIQNENYDHYKLLQPERKPEDVVVTSSPPQTTQELSTTQSTTKKTDDLTTQPATKSTTEKTSDSTTQPAILDSCQNEDWAKSFDSAGWSTCPSTFPYINGLYRKNPQGTDDPISNLEGATCCESFKNISSECDDVDWKTSFDKQYHWNLCTPGYYLSGLYRTDSENLQSIDKARCCKPSGAPDSTTTCYNETVRSSFKNEGMVSCTTDGYYITGLYRSDCGDLYCIEELKCCKL